MDAVAAFYSERLFLAVRVVAGDSPAMQCHRTVLAARHLMLSAGPSAARSRYPFTLTRENDNIARPVVGLPIESAGRKVVKVVKISMFFFTCGSSALSSFES